MSRWAWKGCAWLPCFSSVTGWISSHIVSSSRLAPAHAIVTQTACRPGVDHVEAEGSGQLEQQPGEFPWPVAGDHVVGGDLAVTPGRRGLGPGSRGPERAAGVRPSLAGGPDVGAGERVL